ncbi:response regulator [Variovorax paradoxus]|nr:response regulator [Variovorax paradoxus]
MQMAPSTARPSTDCSLRVLVVEDDPDVLEAALEALEFLGHWATGVRSAEAALSRFLEGAFDVLMVDIGLPALSGLELAGKLQSRCKLPVVFATARKPPESLPQGAVWLSKPFSLEQLAEALGQACRCAESGRAAGERTAPPRAAPSTTPAPRLETAQAGGPHRS